MPEEAELPPAALFESETDEARDLVSQTILSTRKLGCFSILSFDVAKDQANLWVGSWSHGQNLTETPVCDLFARELTHV